MESRDGTVVKALASQHYDLCRLHNRFPFSQNVLVTNSGNFQFQMEIKTFTSCSKLEMSSEHFKETFVMAQEDNKIKMKLLCSWNGNFHANRLEWKNWSTSKCRPFVLENLRLIYAYHFYDE